MSLCNNDNFTTLTKATGNAIRRVEGTAQPLAISGHVQILRDHGSKIFASKAMIDVYAELAKPDTTGGVVVILERPSGAEETRYGGGYHTVLSKTKTLNEVAKLISLATNNALTIKDVTVLDAFPLQPNDDPSVHGTKLSSQLLNELLYAKQPDFVISCFRAGSHEGLITILQHPGVGHRSNNRHIQVTVSRPRHRSHKFCKIDAFHPSFAFNYYKDVDCFLQLLRLQFAKAFGEWRETWQEASWMDDLRHEAKITLKTIRSASERSLTEQQSLHIISQMKAMKLSEHTGNSPSFLLGTGHRALQIPKRIMDEAKPMHGHGVHKCE